MSRLILTFPTLFQVLAADKALQGRVNFRPTPTPPGLSADICGMSIELLHFDDKHNALTALSECNLEPSGVHEIP
jgi:hypothetical protein